MTLLFSLIAKYWHLLSLISLLVITVFSLLPLPALPDAPGSDKAHHLIAYAVLIFPAALRSPRHLFWIVCFFAAWSGAIELVQPFVNRYGEMLDLLANVSGLFIGLMAGLAIKRFLIFRL